MPVEQINTDTTRVDVNKVIEWLNSKWQGAKTCPICRENKWIVSDKTVELHFFNPGGLVIGGPVIPLVVVTCNNCGHTLLFNALKVGAIQAPQQAKTSE